MIHSSLREDNKPDGSGYSQPTREAEVKYTQSMAELHKQFPDDREATIFYALALNISAKRSDKTHADLKRCTALLYPLFAEMPNHPGVAHYIIHCNDNPEMAKYGLEAARKYAQIAPDSTHATHMPSHIFAQMGLWKEMVESNRVSLRAAEENPNAMSCEKVGNALHAMSFLVVALPQSGRMQEAQSVLEHSQRIKPAAATGDRCNDEGKSEVLAAYVIETGDWKRAKELKIKEGYSSPLMGTVWMAVGIGAVQTGDMAQAETAERQLAAMRDARSKLPGQSVDNGLEALRLALAGWRAEQAGEKAVAEQDLRKAADLQDRLESNYVIIKPVREMLADLLLLNGNQAEALAEYRAVLVLQPNRFNSVYGAGTAALRAGDMVTAKVYYTQLLGLAEGDERPELVAARSKIAEKVSAALP
jgi:tetratricopeptide (TPR) repeat protein